ncbi:MAG: hypothetical protein QOD77_1728 [Thermoplasmata archaeon]|jgi:DNA-binding transcriptional ArsR family regulator|nr:hypothetical protein [Thermoplasmata archaeon]
MPRAVRTRKAAVQDEAFRALADATRRQILVVLAAGPMRAGDVAARFAVSRPAVSRHLRVLRAAGLVQVEARGRERWHAIADAGLREAAGYVGDVADFWRTHLAKLDRTLR